MKFRKVPFQVGDLVQAHEPSFKGIGEQMRQTREEADRRAPDMQIQIWRQLQGEILEAKGHGIIYTRDIRFQIEWWDRLRKEEEEENMLDQQKQAVEQAVRDAQDERTKQWNKESEERRQKATDRRAELDSK